MFALLFFILCYFLILLYNFSETLSTLNQYIQYFSQKHHISHLSLAVLFLSSVIFLKVKKLGKSPSLIPNVKNYLITSGNSVVIIILQNIFFAIINFFTFLLYTIQYTITNCRSQITATFSSSCYYNWHITLAYNFLCLDHIYKTYRHSNYKYRFYSVFFY